MFPSRHRLPAPVASTLLALTLMLAACGGADDAATGGGDAAGGDTVAATPPDPDIWIAALEGTGPELRLGVIRNATRRPGYDNQPAFAGPGRLLYTRDEDGDADIWQLDLASGEATAFTTTSPESEYSATPLPFATGISVIQVEADSTQRLWQVDGDGAPVAPLFPGVAPVGYHAWLDETRALLFVLGNPSTLHLAERGAAETRVVARNVGRSLQSMPGGGAVSYVQRTEEGGTEIRVWSLASGESRRVADGLEGGDDHAWTPDGILLQAAGNRVYALDPDDGEWQDIGGVDSGGTVSRMAVSPDGRTVALVVTAS